MDNQKAWSHLSEAFVKVTLSPFRFLLCTEGLHGLITQATIQGDIKGTHFAEMAQD